MNILCIDASLTSTGWALFVNKKLTKVGKIQPKEKTEKRLLFLYNEIIKICKNENINLVLFEDGFTNKKNFKAGLQLAEFRGIIKLICLLNNIEYKTGAPLEIKKKITGKGNSTKLEVFQKLAILYANDEVFLKIGDFSDKSGKDKTSDIYDAISFFSLYDDEKDKAGE